MLDKTEKTILSKNKIKRMVKEQGAKISKDYAGKSLLLIGVLNGAFVFLADLIREITIPVEIDFIAVSSYGKSTKTTGIVKILKDIDAEVQDKHVIIVEDLVDTGLTLNYIKKMIQNKGPLSLKVCTAFDKQSRRMVEIVVDYGGIKIPDEFIVGYGLDFEGKYRNCPVVKVVSI